MNASKLLTLIQETGKKIAPAWSLKNSVAVNPYLGLSDFDFKDAADLLHEASGIETYMPIHFYKARIDNGEIIDQDINQALVQNGHADMFAAELMQYINHMPESAAYDASSITSYIDLAASKDTVDWSTFVTERITNWASHYFNQAEGPLGDSAAHNLYKHWLSEARVDRSAYVMGFKNYSRYIAELPEDYDACLRFLAKHLKLPQRSSFYMYALGLKFLGWASYISGEDWRNNLKGASTQHLDEFMVILLCYEFLFLSAIKDNGWNADLKSYVYIPEPGVTANNVDEKTVRQVLQDAFDIASRRVIIDKFNTEKTPESADEPCDVQAVFCIDVRSEPYRRSLESHNKRVDTIGFAGFFGFPVHYVPYAYDRGNEQGPALIPTALTIRESFGQKDALAKASKKRLTKHQVRSIWKKFKSGAVASFGFVSPMGLSYLPKLVSDMNGWTRPVEDPSTDGLTADILAHRRLIFDNANVEEIAGMAANALNGMGIAQNIAPLVVLVGHASTSVNNPHATGLDCGACGGHSGEINALTAATVFNDETVRRILREKHGIDIPNESHFMAGVHNTTTDEVRLLKENEAPRGLSYIVKKLKESLEAAGETTRHERSEKLNIVEGDVHKSIFRRANDWSQVRPELGLAGCNALVVAPRSRTKHINLEGRSFLHSYDHRNDPNFAVLEGIMTAPLVVTSWINLQYFASTVDNKRLGAGNKTLHNVTGGLGVLEGSSGDLRIGLPWQSIHDGENYQHLPNRLSVVIEAPMEAVNTILEKHDHVKTLFDNHWLSLMLLDANGKIAHYYKKNLAWQHVATEPSEARLELNQLVAVR